MIVSADGLAKSRLFHGFNGFGGGGTQWWTNPTVISNYPITFNNNAAWDDFMNAPHGPTATPPISALDPSKFNALQQWFVTASGDANTSSNLVLAAQTWQQQLQTLANAMSLGQQSDTNVMGIDTGRSSAKNAVYLASDVAMKNGVDLAIQAMQAAYALDQGANPNGPTTTPANAPNSSGSTPPAGTPPGTYVPGMPMPGTTTYSDQTVAPTTDYTPYYIGGAAVAVVGAYLFLRKKKE
jgi:hypothetical protein